VQAHDFIYNSAYSCEAIIILFHHVSTNVFLALLLSLSFLCI